MHVWSDSHIVFIYVMIISIIILNLCLSAYSHLLDWYRMTTGNRYNGTKTVIITAGMRSHSFVLFLNLPQLESSDICWFGTWLSSCQQ
jgi:hypothetical protein